MHISPSHDREASNPDDYTDEEKARIKKFINFMAGKDEDPNGKLQFIN
jgi:hypothetical protein